MSESILSEIQHRGSHSMYMEKYIASFCKNDDSQYMWSERTYAIGFVTERIKRIASDNGFILSDCRYYEDDRIKDEIGETINKSEGKQDLVKILLMRAITTKSQGFKKEEECRIYSNVLTAQFPNKIRFRVSESKIIPYYPLPLGDLSSIEEIKICTDQDEDLAFNSAYRVANRYGAQNISFGTIRIVKRTYSQEIGLLG